jgi:hypothetical protein
VKADVVQMTEGSSFGLRYGEQSGHHRGLRSGHVVIGVTWELGRSKCFLVHKIRSRAPVSQRGEVLALGKGCSNQTSERKQRSKQGIRGG